MAGNTAWGSGVSGVDPGMTFFPIFSTNNNFLSTDQGNSEKCSAGLTATYRSRLWAGLGWRRPGRNIPWQYCSGEAQLPMLWTGRPLALVHLCSLHPPRAAQNPRSCSLLTTQLAVVGTLPPQHRRTGRLSPQWQLAAVPCSLQLAAPPRPALRSALETVNTAAVSLGITSTAVVTGGEPARLAALAHTAALQRYIHSTQPAALPQSPHAAQPLAMPALFLLLSFPT